MDTKKKELVGDFENQGRQWRHKGTAPRVQSHDFPGPSVPRAFPYGIYDLRRNAGFVNVGTDHDTATFAVASIRGWWQYEGRRLYPRATDLLITADGGGSNGYRLRLWKLELQRLADQTELFFRIELVLKPVIEHFSQTLEPERCWPRLCFLASLKNTIAPSEQSGFFNANIQNFEVG